MMSSNGLLAVIWIIVPRCAAAQLLPVTGALHHVLPAAHCTWCTSCSLLHLASAYAWHTRAPCHLQLHGLRQPLHPQTNSVTGLPGAGSVPVEKYEDPAGLALPPATLPFLDAWKRPEELVQGAPTVPIVLLRPATDAGSTGEKKGAVMQCSMCATFFSGI